MVSAPELRRGSMILLLYITFIFLPCVRSHGYLIEPPNRASLWRLKIPGSVVDIQDSLRACGGFQKQWNFNEGNCGPCGDDYSLPKPRPYENMGANSRGIVARTYREAEIIQVSVIIKESRKGYFLFNICKLKRDDSVEDEKCFEKYPLKLDTGGYRYRMESWQPGNYTMKLELPIGLTCERCVLRWHYTAGNSWGKCADGTQGLGCGPQETYRTCSDIAILPQVRTEPNALKLPILPGFGHKLSHAHGVREGIPLPMQSFNDESFD